MIRTITFFICCFLSIACSAQTVVLSGTGNGGFELGPNFGANGWTAVNGPANQWAVGTGSIGAGVRGAYIGNPTTFVGANTAAVNHFYRTTAIPAGAKNVQLYFKYRQPVVDDGWDSLMISTSTTATPVAGATLGAGYRQWYANTGTAYANYVVIGPVDLTPVAGTSPRLIFTYKNDGSNPIGVPAVDSISFSYCDSSTGNGNLCLGGATPTTTLSNLMPGGAWTSSDPSIATVGGSSGLVTSVAPGTATITYTQGNCVVTRLVSVNPQPDVIAGTLTVCQNSMTTLTNTVPGGAWTSSTPAIGTVSSTGDVTGMSAGTTTITYALGTCRSTAVVTANAAPGLHNVTGGGNLCPGAAGAPIGLDGSNNGIDYALSDGTAYIDTMSGTGGALAYGTYTVAGTYTVLATNTVTGCTRAMGGSATITFVVPVTPAVAISATDTTVCDGTSVTFTATPTNGGTSPTYDWYVNGTNMLMGAPDNYTHTVALGDNIEVKLHPDNICVAPDTAISSFAMIVTAMSTPAVSISVAPGNPICAGTVATFTATPAFGGSAPSYTWKRNGVYVATGTAYMYLPHDGDAVSCKITSNYECRLANEASSSDIVMHVDSAIGAPAVTITAHPGLNIAAGQSDTLKAIATTAAAGVSYQWMVNGMAVAGATSDTYISNTLANNDVVTCKVTNLTTCRETTHRSVTIGVGTGVHDVAEGSSALHIFPDPNKGSFTIAGPSGIVSGHVSLQVTNMLGEVMYKSSIATQNSVMNERIDLGNSLAPGMYLLQIHSADGIRTLRFVVEQ